MEVEKEGIFDAFCGISPVTAVFLPLPAVSNIAVVSVEVLVAVLLERRGAIGSSQLAVRSLTLKVPLLLRALVHKSFLPRSILARSLLPPRALLLASYSSPPLCNISIVAT